MIKGDSETSDLKYPAVTICPKISTKYAIAERLGNYIDPGNLPKGLLALQQELFLCASGFMDANGKSNWGVSEYVNWYFDQCDTMCWKDPKGCEGCTV